MVFLALVDHGLFHYTPDHKKIQNIMIIYKIIWIVHAFQLVYKLVHFHCTMKHKNDISNMVASSPSSGKLGTIKDDDDLPVVKIYSFMKEKYTYALCISFFSLLRWKIQ